MYRQVFFPLVLLAFLFAGTNLPVGSVWTIARWVILGWEHGWVRRSWPGTEVSYRMI